MSHSSPVSFNTLGLSNDLLRALTDEGYHTPTPIQAQAIPHAVQGRDMLGCAQTGTGKTAAFALPILHRLSTIAPDKNRRGPVLPRALILSPTRELATQIGDSFATYGRHTGLDHTVVFGGVSQFHQVRALHRGVDILVATPGRLIDLMEQRLVNLSEVGIFVLDEADRMLDMGFIQPIRRIAAALPKGPTPRQTLLFSATMPREIMHLADSLLREPVKVAVTPVASAAPLIEQGIYLVSRMRKMALLEHLLETGEIDRAVVFTRTKHGADKVSKRLKFAGISAEAIHGNKAQNQRQRALDAFRAGRSRVLVATDVAARGLDVDAITHVFNFDLPDEPEAYVHRIGRTGRAGATGIAVSFCDEDQRVQLRDIERLTGKTIERLKLPTEFADAGPEPFRGSSRSDASRGSQSGPARSGSPARAPGAYQPRAHQRGHQTDPGHRPAPHPHHADHSPRSESPTRGPASGPSRGPSRGPTNGRTQAGSGQPKRAPHSRTSSAGSPTAKSGSPNAHRAGSHPSARADHRGPAQSGARAKTWNARTGQGKPRRGR